MGTLKVLPAERAALVRGLFELAAWVCDHPELPLPAVSARVPSGYHAHDVVDAVAGSTGMEPFTECDRRKYAVEAGFGPVRLSCIAYGPRVLRESRVQPGAPRGGKSTALLGHVAAGRAVDPASFGLGVSS
ncbi:hypothetical protein [Microlunatus parietis]|uniref:Uncharacterized protein n=1 Tax=Microlunatus parietis TaxID=682979 RepID=A0A7Y9IDC6_9ACTN|nr:hypothetical protein [Microlunatus parietis]NYE74239.1 hypothetical protein [Microlunatus parietis]